MTAAPAYCRGVIAAAALAGVCLFIAAGLAWTARLVHVGNLDALALAEKTATPWPVSALDWPELRVREVAPQDLPGERSLILLLVEWPPGASRRPCSSTSAALDRGPCRCSRSGAPPGPRSPRPGWPGGEPELRRRQSLERVRGLLVAEDTIPARLAAPRPGREGIARRLAGGQRR